jgi:hypothetical protein
MGSGNREKPDLPLYGRGGGLKASKSDIGEAMKKDSDVNYFEDWDTDDIFACIGSFGHGGLFRLRNPKGGNKVWEFQIPTGPAFDMIHQRVFRNFRATKILSAEIISNFPPLPDVPKGPFPKREEFYLPKEKAMVSAFPAVARLIGMQIGKFLKVYVVLEEDKYESSFGDGVFHDFKDAFLNEQDGLEFVNANSNNDYVYHLRNMTVEIEQNAFEFPDYKLAIFDHYDPVAVLASLENKYK